MKTLRLLEVFLVIVALFSWSLTCFLTIPSEQRLQPFIWFLTLIPFIGFAYYRSWQKKPFFKIGKRSNLGLSLLAFTLALAKHTYYPCHATINSLVSFSLVFHMTMAFGFLAVVELYRQRLEKDPSSLIAYTFFIMVGASFTGATSIFILCMTGYVATLVLLNRIRLESLCPRGNFSHSRAWIWILGVFLVFCFTTMHVLAHYRKEVKSWHPFSSLLKSSSSTQAGFSPISQLRSKDIATSREPVLRYFAPPAVYYLRGKVYDQYEESRWKLSQLQENAKEIESDGKDVFLITPLEFVKDTDQWTDLVFLNKDVSIIFAPLETLAIRIQASQARKNRVFQNEEGALWASSELGRDQIQMLISPRAYYSPVPKEHDRYLALPENEDFFITLSREIIGKESSPNQQVLLLQKYLENNYAYSTKVELDPDMEPIENFLRKKDSGHCEMFASSFIMLARSHGIPARYVTGYLAHEWNTLGNFITVRACDAHAWAEVYYDEQGWVQVEPTPPDQLRDLLQNYRGWGEGFREWVGEKIRSFLENPFSLDTKIILLLCGFFITVLISFLAWKLWLKRTPNNQKKFRNISRRLEGNPQQWRQLEELTDEWEKSLGKIFRSRKKNETWREYHKKTQDYLSSAGQAWGEKILFLIEESVYRKECPDQKTLDKLEQEWQKADFNELRAKV